MTTPDLSEMIAPWLVWSHEHNAWWRPKHCGYTLHVKDAGRYTKAEADAICDSRSPRKFEDDPPPEVAVIAPEFADALSASLQREAGLRKALEVGKGYVERIVLDLGLSGERMHGTKIQTDLNQINAALALSTPPPMRAAMNWEPIATAPKDGTEILGYHPEWVHAEFSPDGIRSCIFDGEVWHSSTWRDDDSNVLHHLYDQPPTHWQPLPLPPIKPENP